MKKKEKEKENHNKKSRGRITKIQMRKCKRSKINSFSNFLSFLFTCIIPLCALMCRSVNTMAFHKRLWWCHIVTTFDIEQQNVLLML